MSKLVTSDNLKAYHGELAEHLQLLERDKAYLVGDIVKYDGLTLKCTIAGNTGVNKVDYSSIDVGDTIVDGTVTFTVIDPNSMWYEENKFYMVDDIVVYDDKFYKCITAHTATDTFDTIKWAELSTGGGVDLPEWQANTAYTAGKYLVHEGTVYKVTTNFTSGTTFDDTNLSAYIAPVMTGATSSNDGKSGIVPTPTTNDVEKFLKGDGTWTGLSSSGLFVSKKTLYSGTFNDLILNTPITLTDNINNYDKINIMGRTAVNPSDSYASIESLAESNVGYFVNFTFSGTSMTPNAMVIGSNFDTTSPFYIEGIKFIPSNNVYTSKNLLWSGTHLDIASVNTITLNDDVTNYDVIVMNATGGAASCYAIVDTSVGAVTLAAEELINDPTGKIQIAGYILFSSPNILNFLIKNYGTNYTSSNPCAISVWGLKYAPNPNDYSTTERRIGTWIDGKQLYQVTISGNMSSGTTTTVDISTYGIDTIVETDGKVTGGSGVFFPLNYYYNTTNWIDTVCGYATNISDKKIFINLGTSTAITSSDTYWITIKYTKV